MNRKLFEKFIMQNINSAYRFAFTYVHNKEDAEDIVSQSIEKALKSIETLKNPNSMKSWFYKILSNTACSHLRDSKKVSFVDYTVLESVNGSEDDFSILTFDDFIKKLDVKYKEVIILRFMENMTINEIASILGINDNTVKTRLYRALDILKIDMEVE